MTDTSTTVVPTRSLDGTDLPAAGTYVIDPTHSYVGFTARHAMVAKVKGRFDTVRGTVVIGDDPLASSVDVEIEAASIDTRDQQRDGHLRSPDFLDVERYPALTYRSTGVAPAGASTWIVDGELTVRGVTRAVPLTVEFEGGAVDPYGNARLGFTAIAEIDREAFGLTWNQVLETGGVLVGKKVRIELEVAAVRQ